MFVAVTADVGLGGVSPSALAVILAVILGALGVGAFFLAAARIALGLFGLLARILESIAVIRVGALVGAAVALVLVVLHAH